MRSWDGQRDASVRFDWGLRGARAVSADVDVVVVVDVLSFTTAVTVALDSGTVVLPFPSGDSAAAERFARERRAVLAAGRSARVAGRPSLSPAAIRDCPPVDRLVLPSPNGSALSRSIAADGRTCVAGCLRNALAVGRWVARRSDPTTARVAVIAAGERWPGGALRVAVEDLWGAGAIVAALLDAGFSALSPEAAAAAAAHAAVRGSELVNLLRCASGRELAARGFHDDVAIAAEVDQSASVPVLTGDRFEAG